MVAGMAALELGLLLYYVNGGYRHMYITDGDTRVWPMEYGGALKAIRLEYIVTIFIVAFMLMLVLSYFSFFGKKTSILTLRLPISSKMQFLIQIVHSMIMLLAFWLIQFLIIITGFLLYRYSAPDGLMIDVQIFKIFWYSGLVARLYPFLSLNYLSTWLIWLVCLSLFPSFIAFKARVMENYIIWRIIKILFFVFVFFAIRSLLPELLRDTIDIVVIFLFVLALLGFLFLRDDLFEKENK
jgi:hypothetical protein